MLEVNGVQTQGAALEAVASLCRRVEGDIVSEVPQLCDRALALLWLGRSNQVSAVCGESM